MAYPIRIVRFWTDYKVRPDGTREPIDWVEYCAPGMAQRLTTPATIRSLSRVIEDVDPDNLAAAMARDRWATIKVAYDAWKAGQELPVSGTPLAAWPGVSTQQAEVIRTLGLKTVEEVAQASDTVLNKIQLPGVREIQANARRFLDGRDGVKAAARMGELEAAMALKDEQLNEMREIMLDMQRRMDTAADGEPDADGGEKKRGPGRPRKAPESVAA